MNLTEADASGLGQKSGSVQRCFVHDSDTVKALRITGYSVLILVSLLGNALLIAAVYRYKRLRTTTNIFLANMAVADLLIAVLYMPRMVAMYVNGTTWIGGTLGGILCKIVPFLHGLALLVSVLTLLLISVERLRAFLCPLKSPRDQKVSPKIAIALVWVVAILVRTPYFLALRTMIYPSGRTYCSSRLSNFFGTEKARDIYYTSLLVAFYALPIVLIIVSYLVIIIYLGKRNSRASERTERHITALRKVVRMMIAVSVAFVACWMTYFVSHLIFQKVPCTLRFWRLFLAHSNSALNPCLYTAFNRKLRRGFVNIITGLFTCHRAGARKYRKPARQRADEEMRRRDRQLPASQQEKIEMIPIVPAEGV